MTTGDNLDQFYADAIRLFVKHYGIESVLRRATEAHEELNPIRIKDETLIEDLELSIRSYNCLKTAGFNTGRRRAGIRPGGKIPAPSAASRSAV